MNRRRVITLLDRLHQAQNEFYAGGRGDELRALVAPQVTWVVPGDNLIAGTYRGIDEVLRYFERRRELANRTFRMQRRDILVGTGSRVAALTDGVARLNGSERRWSTVGLYDLSDERVVACWLLPLDQLAFDAIWSPRTQGEG